MGIESYSTTPGNNGTVGGTAYFPEGQSPSSLNDAARQVMADLAALYQLQGGTLSTGGTSNAQTLTPTVAWTTYDNGRRVLARIGSNLTNTGSTTLNVSALGTKTVYKSDGTSTLSGGELVAGAIAEFVYDSTLGGFRIIATTPSLDEVTTNGADIASAGTLDLDAATGDTVDVTGTTTITAITLAAGDMRIVRFTGALTLTNGASLVLPGGANITTAAGDFAIFRGYASSVVRCVSYQRLASEPLAFATQAQMEAASSTAVAATPGRLQYHPGVAKAWVLFNGSDATLSAAASLNVSSLTDNGAADYTVNLTTPFSSPNYVVTAMAKQQAANVIIACISSEASALAAASFRIELMRWDGFVLDSDAVCCAAFGDQ